MYVFLNNWDGIAPTFLSFHTGHRFNMMRKVISRLHIAHGRNNGYSAHPNCHVTQEQRYIDDLKTYQYDRQLCRLAH